MVYDKSKFTHIAINTFVCHLNLRQHVALTLCKLAGTAVRERSRRTYFQASRRSSRQRVSLSSSPMVQQRRTSAHSATVHVCSCGIHSKAALLSPQSKARPNGVKGSTELDNKEKLLRVISASPFIPITVSACKSDPAFVAVGCYRLVAIVGRLLLVPYFQVLTHDVLKLPFVLHLGAKGVWQPAIGASLLLTLDFGIQAALVYRSTANSRKLGWTFANVISPTEPILHGGSQPMFTTSPRVAAGVHAAEALVAACVVIWAQGGVGSTTTFLQVNLRTIDHMLLAICGCCCLLQLPMLLLVQRSLLTDLSRRKRGVRPSTWLPAMPTWTQQTLQHQCT